MLFFLLHFCVSRNTALSPWDQEKLISLFSLITRSVEFNDLLLIEDWKRNDNFVSFQNTMQSFKAKTTSQPPTFLLSYFYLQQEGSGFLFILQYKYKPDPVEINPDPQPEVQGMICFLPYLHVPASKTLFPEAKSSLLTWCSIL